MLVSYSRNICTLSYFGKKEVSNIIAFLRKFKVKTLAFALKLQYASFLNVSY